MAIGGNVRPNSLIKAYSQGLFPWNDHPEVPMWYSPDPRAVLSPPLFKYSKSLRSSLRKKRFTLKHNSCFEEVLQQCADIKRKGQNGTWLYPELQRSLAELKEMGKAHSIEVFEENNLVGGLYGVQLGKVFFGESMFSKVSDSSKIALYALCRSLPDDALIDCQQRTEHLLSLGAHTISRSEFLKTLGELTHQPMQLELADIYS